MTLIIKNQFLFFSFVLLLGLISSFSLPPYNFFYLNFLSYPALLWILLIYTNNKLKSFYIGWVFGFSYFISSLYWITNSLTFDNIFKPLIPFALILIPLFLGLFYGLSTLIFSLLNPKKNFLAILILTTSLSIFEYIRSFILGGFPWNLISFSLVNYLELIQLLSITGTYAFNSLIILLFLLPSILFLKYKKNFKLGVSIISLVVFLSNFFWGNFSLKNYEFTETKDL